MQMGVSIITWKEMCVEFWEPSDFLINHGRVFKALDAP